MRETSKAKYSFNGRKYITYRIEVFAQLTIRNISQRSKGVKYFESIGEIEKAKFIENLTEVQWTLGMFEAAVCKDDFAF